MKSKIEGEETAIKEENFLEKVAQSQQFAVHKFLGLKKPDEIRGRAIFKSSTASA